MSRRMRIAVAAALVVGLAGCSSGSTDTPEVSSSPPAKVTGNVSFWHFFEGREAEAIQKQVDAFEAANPGLTVDVKSQQDDEKTIQAIASGQPIDAVLSYSTDQIGKFCSTGAWQDLGPYMARDGVDVNQIPAVPRGYTEFEGTRCAMPALSDVYGLYYNKDLLAEAGYTEPPKTLEELDEMAKKLTKRSADGTIEQAGFVPLNGFYENAPSHFAPSFGAEWFNADGKSNLAADPAWTEMLTWQKGLTDWYGYENLRTFTAGLGQEFSADNAFQAGKVAMIIDGEYRNAFIKAETPDLDYGTSAFPTPAAHSDLTGAGYITGNVMGIGKGSQNPEAAWALIKYLTTNTDTVVELANAIKNIPTWTPALESPKLDKDETYQPFLDIFANPNSATTPATASGKAYQDTFSTFVSSYLSGKVDDLAAGLAATDQAIDDQIALGEAP